MFLKKRVLVLMNDDWKRALLIYTSSVLGFVSFVASYYVVVSSLYFKTKLINNQKNAYKKIGKKVNPANDIRLTNDYTVTDIIMWMSLTDLIFDIWLLLNYVPQSISETFRYSDNICKIVGIIGQFGGTASPLWHLIMAWNLFYLLTKKDNHYNKFTLINQKPTLIVLLLICTIMGTIIPIIGGAYGKFTNNQQFSEWECWINKKDYQLIIFIPIIISVFFHYIVLIIACFKYVKTKSYTTAYVILIKRLIVWIIVFSIIRIIPAIVRFMSIFNLDDDEPFILIALHHYCVGLWGFGNGFVWFYNTKCSNVNTTTLHDYNSQALLDNNNDTNTSDTIKKSNSVQNIHHTSYNTNSYISS